MTLRPLRESDIPRLRELYELQGFAYPFPEFASQPWAACWAIVDEADCVMEAVAARYTVELYLFADPRWKTPRWRFEAFRQLHEQIRLSLLALGLKDAHCWIPPQLEKSFARRLRNGFGWMRNGWLCLSRTTERKVARGS